MEERQLSQAEVWDDSALVDSWNEAFEEYKKYHSLAAKGEKVKVKTEQIEEILINGDNPAPLKLDPDAEVTEAADVQTEAGAGLHMQPVDACTTAPTAPALPQVLLGSVQNEDLKNLMMSWYYAGYYTGLYEGKQQGYASAMQRQAG